MPNMHKQMRLRSMESLLIKKPNMCFFRCELVDDEECDIVMENVCKMEKSVSCRTVEKAAWKVIISQIQ